MNREQKIQMDDGDFGQIVLSTTGSNPSAVSVSICESQTEFLDLLIRRFVTITECDSVSAWQVTNAIYGAASVRTIDQELVAKLANMAIHGPIFRELSNRGLCMLINCFGYLNRSDPQAVDLILSEILHPTRLPLSSEYGLYSVLQGLAMLRYTDRKNISILMSEITRPWRLTKYTMWELTGLWIYASRLGIRDNGVLDLLMRETMRTERMESLASKSLFIIIVSMAQLKYRNSAFLHAFIEEITSKRRLDAACEQDYPGYFWCLGQLEYGNVRDVQKMVKSFLSVNRLKKMPEKKLASILYGFSHCTLKDKNSISVLLTEISKPERLENFSRHSMASLIHSLGRLELPICPQLQAVLEEAVKPERMMQYSEYGLVAIIHGLANLKIVDHNLLLSVLAEIRKPERIAAYQPGALTCLVGGLSALRSTDGDLLRRLAGEIAKTERMKALSPSALASLIINFAELKFENLDVIERLLTAIVEASGLEAMSNSMLASFLFALGQLHYNNSKKIVMPIIDEVTRRRNVFKNHELGAIVHGLGNMGLRYKDYFTLKHIILETLNPDRISNYTIKELGRVCSALSLMEYRGADIQPLLQCLVQPDIFGNLDFKDLAVSAYALGQAGMQHPDMLTQLKKEVFRRGKHVDASQRCLSVLVQGVGSMCHNKDYSFGQMILEILYHQYGKNIDELTNQNLTSILYGLGQVGIENKAMLYPFIVDSIKTRRLQQYSEHELATVIFALGQFRFHDTPPLLSILKEVCLDHRLRFFNNRQLMGTLFSFCNMNIVEEKLLEPLLRMAAQPASLVRCSGSDLSMLFFSLVKINPKNYSYLLNALNEMTHPDRLKSLGDVSLNAILFSITGLKHHARSPSVLRPIIDQLALPGRLENMDGNVLGNIMYSLGRVNYVPVDFMDLVAAEASKSSRLGTLSETALCNIINTVGKSKYDNRGFLNLLLDEAMKGKRLRSYHEGHLLNIVYAMGSLRFYHERFIGFLERVLSDVRDVDKFQPKTLLMIMHSYWLLGVGSQQTVMNITKSVLSNPERLSKLSDAQLSCLMDTLGKIQKHGKIKQESLDETSL